MAIEQWSVKSENLISNTTKIKDADNKIQATIDDLNHWVNGTNGYEATGLKTDIEQYKADNDSFFADNQATFDAKIVEYNNEFNEDITGYQVEFNAKKAEWDTELQSVVDDTVVSEW